MMNPRAHLRMTYESNPIAFLVANAGGVAVDGREAVLGIRHSDMHERRPLFVGSRDDISEMLSYGDVRQLGSFGYTAVV